MKKSTLLMMTKSFLLMAGFIALSMNSFSQNSEKMLATIWKPLIQNEYVAINYRYANCDLPTEGTNVEEVYFQFINVTDQPVTFSWEEELKYGKKCYNCDGSNKEMTHTITLQANEKKEGSCGVDSPQELKVFSKFLNMASETVLTDFKLKNLQRK